MGCRPSDIRLIRLQGDSGFGVELLNLGASIRSIRLPLSGGVVDATLSYADLTDYLSDAWYMGSTLGRYANRLAQARLRLDGRDHELAPSPGQSGHCLHGGPDGFSRRPWQVDTSPGGRSASFTLDSPDGDQGFPGNVTVEVTYRLLDGWKLGIEYLAETDAPTVVNLANHCYFNLNDDDSPADNHRVQINADRYTPVREDLIPSGECLDVTGTPFDFRQPAAFSERLDSGVEQLRFAAGFDHNYVLREDARTLFHAASLQSPQSGLVLNLFTTQPGLQFYTGQYLGGPFAPFQGICLEAQNFPNAPNTPGFPNAILLPGRRYRRLVVYEFSTGSKPRDPRFT
jgi:aldose 1-epimerase